MAIIIRSMAKVELRPEDRPEVLNLYVYQHKNKAEWVKNYKYKDGIAYLPLNMEKLKLVSHITGQEIIDERSMGAACSDLTIKPEFKLRDYQVAPASNLLAYIKKNQYGVLRAACGAGKTIVMTYVAGQLGRKIIILVDMGSLLSQWVAAFEIVYGITPQIITKDTTQFSDVCVATFQLLNLNPELLQKMKTEFGTCLVDEFHISAAVTFKDVLFSLNNYYRIGCTATPLRKNFDDDYLADLISTVSVEMEDPHALTCKVYFVNTGVKLYSNDPDDWGKIQSRLSKDLRRSKIIAHLTLEACRQGRKVVVIGITNDGLKIVSEILSKFPECKHKIYTGSTTLKQDLKIKEELQSGEINTILSINKLSKGADLPSLDYLIMARPMNNEAAVTQISGRIVRKMEGKPVPIIVDLVDDSDLARRFATNRRRFYSKLGYEIST